MHLHKTSSTGIWYSTRGHFFSLCSPWANFMNSCFHRWGRKVSSTICEPSCNNDTVKVPLYRFVFTKSVWISSLGCYHAIDWRGISVNKSSKGCKLSSECVWQNRRSHVFIAPLCERFKVCELPTENRCDWTCSFYVVSSGNCLIIHLFLKKIRDADCFSSTDFTLFALTSTWYVGKPFTPV